MGKYIVAPTYVNALTEKTRSRTIPGAIKMLTQCSTKNREMYEGKIQFPVAAIKDFLKSWGDCILSISEEESDAWDKAQMGLSCSV